MPVSFRSVRRTQLVADLRAPPSRMDVLIAVYREIHPPLVTLLCISGTIGHILSIATLSSMLNPTNLLLISMSGSQLVLCVNYLYTILFKFGTDTLCLASLWGWGWTASFLVSVNLSVMVHMTGVFHVVALSIVRYFSLKRISEVSSTLPWFTYQKSTVSLVIIYVSMLIVCGPIYFHSEIREVPFHETCASKFPDLNGTVAYELSVRNHALQQINFWLFGSICKLIPCLVLFIMTFFILDRLKRIRHINERFGSHERDRRYDRTTKMILIIMLVFIMVELPQGIMAVLQSVTQLSGMQELGDLFEMLTLLTSCIIFALLCSMNSSLRNELYRLFCRRFQRWTDNRRHRKTKGTCVELAYLVNGNEKKAIRMSPSTSVGC
ncbi:hypothetical protein QR680_001170 [Steinernema hermaphroditum]|uniref:G-protein coupled receptors family 1 profile domain-containing protein n=1 Tax=Steinernema hermaphroditum TaxID=289476 RepID=A0AA39GX61_9BILA|nr:hypothetical protein QR680_001170 [Steinernema hermaphroditum]